MIFQTARNSVICWLSAVYRYHQKNQLPRIRKWGFFFLLVVFALQTEAQIPEKPDWDFQLFEFPQVGINHEAQMMVQDSFGFLWFGTTAGLHRYDGHRVKSYYYDPDDPNSLSFNYIECITITSDTSIWLGSWGGGLDRFNPKTETAIHYELVTEDTSELGVRYISEIVEDRDGFIWLATSQAGVFRLDPNTGEYKNFLHDPDDPSSLSNNSTRAIYVDSEGTLWVGGGLPWNAEDLGGLNRYDPATESFIAYHHDPNDPNTLISNKITAIFEDSRNNFWIGTTKSGLHKMDRKKGTFTRYVYDPLNPKSLHAPYTESETNHVTSIIEDVEGKIWIGSYEANIIVYDPATETVIQMPQKRSEGRDAFLIGRVAFDIVQIKDGSIWLGGGSRGRIYKGTKPPIQIDRDGRGYGGTVQGITRTNSGDLWASSHFLGLWKKSPEGNYANYASLPGENDTINFSNSWKIYPDKNDNLWINRWWEAGGVTFFNPSNFQVIHFQNDPGNDQSLPHNFITDMVEDESGNLWLTAVGGGLIKMDVTRQTFTSYLHDPNDPQSLQHNNLVRILKTADNKFWVAGTDGGTTNSPDNQTLLARFDPETASFKHYSVHHANDAGFSSLIEDKQGNIWLATESSVKIIDPVTENVAEIPSEDFNFFCRGLLPDDQGNIWIMGKQFLTALNENLEVVQLLRPEFLEIESFHFNSCYKDEDGKLYFGGTGGYVSFFPNVLSSQEKEITLKPRIVDLRLNSAQQPSFFKSQSAPNIWEINTIPLRHFENSFTIQLSCFDLRNPKLLQYQYKLEGRDISWKNTSILPEASYYDLSPGNYKLRLRVVTGEGKTSEENVVSFIISPPWWKTWWAYTLYLILGISTLASYIKYRTDSLRKYQKKLEKTVAERTAEVVAEKERSEALLLNILPREVAKELMETGQAQPVRFEEVSILFVDFKDFTSIVATMPTKSLVRELNDIFQKIDDIIQSEGLEKIKTIGDAYLAASGLPKEDPNHALNCVQAAKRIITFLQKRNQSSGVKWKARVGIHSGPITAGVVGKRKFTYDLFGDTINIASRIETAGEAGQINVSAYTYDLIKGTFPCKYRGKINAKGKGEIDMYFVED